MKTQSKIYHNFSDKYGNSYSFPNYMSFAKFWFNLRRNIAISMFPDNFDKLQRAAANSKEAKSPATTKTNETTGMTGNYWGNKGKFQKEYDKLEQEIGTEDFEDIKNKDLQMVYAIGQIYHDVYNNGASNMLDWVELEDDTDDDREDVANKAAYEMVLNDHFDKMFISLGRYVGASATKFSESLIRERIRHDGIDKRKSPKLFDELEALTNEVIEKAYKNYFRKNESIVVSFEKFVMNESEGSLRESSVKQPVVKATDETIHDLVRSAVEKHGNRVDLNFIDTSEVTNFVSLFEVTKGDDFFKDFNGNISKWNTSNVRSMSRMFRNTSFNGDISKWDTSNATNMNYMFESSKFNGNISKWNTSNVKDMSYMFDRSKFNGDISKWDVSKVWQFSNMFSESEFSGDISRWNVKSGEFFYKMFYTNNYFNSNLNKWELKNYSDVRGMFYGCEKFEPKNISSWDLDELKNGDKIFDK